MIFNRVPNINDAIVSVHCHDDRGNAVENSLVALDLGVRQIECAIGVWTMPSHSGQEHGEDVVQGLGARKGNANL